MLLYKSTQGAILLHDNNYYLLMDDWDTLVNQTDLYSHLLSTLDDNKKIGLGLAKGYIKKELLVPIGSQEVWAAGVTYLRSLDARKDEAKDAGAADCYQRVYDAERPELFFKSLPHRVAGHGSKVNIRKDSEWNVPEPELTLYINSPGKIQAYTIGNDMSSRSIEGENPLYLPQAKMYERSAALGPCLYIPGETISLETTISITIKRSGVDVFDGSIQLNRMKRKLEELAEYLFRENDFKQGCFLMTGTGIVPPNDFTLKEDDEVEISIENIGLLSNTVAYRK
ncbi:MAG: fumarylacetoacetate hydrolase family protein [Ginsengibacter sp.]